MRTLSRIIPIVLVAVLMMAASAKARVLLPRAKLAQEHRVDVLKAQVLHWRHRAVSLSSEVGPTQETDGPITTWSIPFLVWLRRDWHHRAMAFAKEVKQQALAPAITTSASTPAASFSGSLIAAFNCISTKEEYGVTGPNTVAGYFGMVSPPSAYPSPGPEYAAQYGDSWLDIPLAAQYQIAIAEYNVYGWSPWTTAGACGL